jgi:hypothetical protein
MAPIPSNTSSGAGDTAGISFGPEALYSYTQDDTVDPQEACRQLTGALEAAGWTADNVFSPSEQFEAGNAGYGFADLSFFMPAGALVWIHLECPHDGVSEGEPS